MFNSRYSKVLTVLLIIVIIAIIGILIFMGYDFYRKYYMDKDAQDFIERYDEEMNNVQNNTIDDPQDTTPTVIDPGAESNTTSGGSSSGSKKYSYKGFGVLGTIEIPKSGIKYPILDTMSVKALETSIVYTYGPGVNEIGNTTLAGHNYRNGSLFGKNKKLAKGDVIYLTDNSGKKVTYTIYNIYQTTPQDTDYMTRDTNGKREISLTTCTDDSKSRLIIWAKES